MSRDEQKNRVAGLELAQIIFIGRTFEEYMKMFNLTVKEIKGKSILDCPGGACSFSSHARELGADPMAADIAYEHESSQLEVKGLQDIEHTMKQMEQVQNKYRWDDFGSIHGLKEERRRAITDCVADMRRFPDRYVASILPELPFSDEQFDLTLSAHFLFTYADRLDTDFHLQTILELLRVTKRELRIFPTVDLSGKRYEHMDELKAILEERGYITSEEITSYEFQRGAHTMLHIVKSR
ncbi:class I SAM-dependent methyltransferase [Paenibacillus xylanivorans]|uniref:SAM-dependent methyltransferase n=1 Tax=Paenibacillus xylanivorans TaxID=1705561 RepID=A0A0M9BR54_9BACL|nr:SAM-dependent methyltransferase [Paenibacillus xylanivorans]KOY16656.1 SAM-dependent methyltransferase [Paenibacillus xylanivorans]